MYAHHRRQAVPGSRQKLGHKRSVELLGGFENDIRIGDVARQNTFRKDEKIGSARLGFLRSAERTYGHFPATRG